MNYDLSNNEDREKTINMLEEIKQKIINNTINTDAFCFLFYSEKTGEVYFTSMGNLIIIMGLCINEADRLFKNLYMGKTKP